MVTRAIYINQFLRNPKGKLKLVVTQCTSYEEVCHLLFVHDYITGISCKQCSKTSLISTKADNMKKPCKFTLQAINKSLMDKNVCP